MNKFERDELGKLCCYYGYAKQPKKENKYGGCPKGCL